MPVPSFLQQAFESTAEHVHAGLPRRPCSVADLAQTRVIAHRGERAQPGVAENSFAAFDPLVDSGVWGIEFDVRWTRDLQPVVVHDADLQRVFGQSVRVAELTLDALRDLQPAIPTLEAMIDRYAERFHLMIELKAEPYPRPEKQRRRLKAILSRLQAGQQFHVLSLDTRLFGHVTGLPSTAWLPVARTNLREMSHFALQHHCAGLAGQFALLGRRWIARHRAAGQVLGTGFPYHRQVMRREINRGVRWLFSNHALRLQRLVDAEQRAR